MPAHEHLLARSLEWTVWEDQSWDVCVRGYPLPPCAQGSVSLPPVRVFPPVSHRLLRPRATPWPKGGAHTLRGELEAHNDEGRGNIIDQ